ncbi:NAD(P)/FAD-dependent oxidoreductase [Microbacterium hominis]|uniref:NAD(P)/FAD-dependent oxidoreductase n=1 Tax=Microbacterium hominis TaxID=162426 RepID=UPI0007685777|nr:FAD-dependent oxidoreductase [Microbacterium hominis]KXC05062.1 pyridine nucleotide-disulfide oxidoreductase [Microbacterium hominis]
MTGPLRLIETLDGRDGFALRDYLTRSEVPFISTVVGTGATRAEGIDFTGRRLPVVVFADGTSLEDPTPAQVAAHLGWVRPPAQSAYDLLIYGAGPAGLSAAVYGASEGLNVAVFERDAVGGQAGSSSLIENYLGFPHGISGSHLADRARQQAVAFGAELILMSQGIDRTFKDHDVRAVLADGSEIRASAAICATGVRWRRLGLPREERLEGSGVYYGAGTSEASACVGRHVYIVGGANSAGQAAMNLSAHATHVTVLVRADSLSSTMSAYLLNRLAAQPNLTVMLNSRVIALHGDDVLDSITVDQSGVETTVATRHLFVCIGGAPNTDWAETTNVSRDSRGFVVTGIDLMADHLKTWPLARAPYYLETSVPGIFAAGDVRSNSVKRVASAVGEGAMAVSLVHRYLAEA